MLKIKLNVECFPSVTLSVESLSSVKLKVKLNVECFPTVTLSVEGLSSVKLKVKFSDCHVNVSNELILVSLHS